MYYLGQVTAASWINISDMLHLQPKTDESENLCRTYVWDIYQADSTDIRKSISLLKNTQKSIQEISDFFNFPNASYFGTFFKKQTGQSPQQYRKG